MSWASFVSGCGERGSGMWRRWAEFVAVYFGGPAAALVWLPRPWTFPLLFAWAAVCGWMLRRDATFDRGQLVNIEGFRRGLPLVLVRFMVLGVALCGLVLWLRPDAWLSFPRQRPGLWALVMVLYPVLSVVPQEVVWRAFLHHRYRGLLPSAVARCAAGAVAFGFAHVVMENWLAVALSTFGGVLFAMTYERSRSLLLACVEHALYGCLVFTVGIGKYLVVGAAGP